MSHLLRLVSAEDGHASTLAGPLVGAVGGVVLGIGAANDNDAMAIAGGVILALGLLAGSLLHHKFIDWEMYRRTEK